MTTELWLEDIHVGHRFRTDVYDLTADDIVEFATKWDPQPFHLSDETAQDTFFQRARGQWLAHRRHHDAPARHVGNCAGARHHRRRR